MVSNALMLVACLPPATEVTSVGLLPRAISGSMIVLQPGSVLTPMTHLTTKAMVMLRGLDHHLWPFWYPRAVPPLVPCGSEWPVLPLGDLMTTGFGLLPGAMSGFMALQQS